MPCGRGEKENTMKKRCFRILLSLALLTLLTAGLMLTVSAASDKTVTEVDITVTGYEPGGNIADIKATIVTDGVVYSSYSGTGSKVIDGYVIQETSNINSGSVLVGGKIAENTEYYLVVVLDISESE